MYPENEGREGQDLNALFRAYREACIAPEPSVNFMPQLWQKIETRQTFSFFFGRVARGFVTAAIAASLGMAVYLASPSPSLYNNTYVDVLAASHSDAPDLYDTAGYDLEEL
jgi:hypothetical protein